MAESCTVGLLRPFSILVAEDCPGTLLAFSCNSQCASTERPGEYIVIHKTDVMGLFDNLGDAKFRLLEYDGWGISRMIVPVTELLFHSKFERSFVVVGNKEFSLQFSQVFDGAFRSSIASGDFNKENHLNWWWSGHADRDRMVDLAKAYVVEAKKEGSLAPFCCFCVFSGRLQRQKCPEAVPLWFSRAAESSEWVGAASMNSVNMCYLWLLPRGASNELAGDPLLDNKGGEDAFPNMPKCTGDCDTSSDCAVGLRCFQRNGVEAVPGCRGEGISGWDYCYDPESLDSTRGVDGSPNMPRCAGECDKDSDCEGSLKCFQRNGFTTVPGCSGSGKKDWDYCYDPYGLDSSRGADGSSSMPKCAGDCDKDSDCAGNLKCWQRDGFSAVPGCNGVGTKDWDYCYDPVDALPPPLDSSPGVHGFPNMPRCAGDCDKDSDCEGSLKCFQRNALEAVPGCSGSGKSKWDYCYDPTMHHGSHLPCH